MWYSGIWILVLLFLLEITSLYGRAVDANFDLFLKQEQVRKLLGLEDELYYVRNGTINYYAMNFTVLVPAHMKELEFTWQAHQKSILYSWSAAYSSLAMTPPMFNISMQGEIPPRLETFRVTFPCTGTVSDDIKVVLQLNISLPHRHGVTSLNFQRNKICLKEEKREEILSNEIPDSGAYFPLPSPHSTPVSYQKPGWPTVLTNQDTIVRSDPPATVTFYVALGCACALIIILLTTMSAVAYLRNQKPPHMESLKSSPLFDSSTSYTSAAYATNPNVFIRLDAMDAGSYDTIASFKKVPMASSVKSVPSPYATTCVTSYKGKTSHHVYATPITYYASSNVSSQLPLQDPRTLDSSDKLRRLSVPRHAVTLKVLLHEGTFGRIYGGTFHDSNENKTVDAIIKTVSDEASKAQINTLLSEGTMMTGLSHNNILGILAVSHDCQLPPLLVYPYSPKGNLKRFLINCRLRGGEKYTLGTQDMVSMAIQVAVAGVYLHTQRLYHRDIAARNVVMDEHMHIKLADNALSRDIFPCDYHCLDDNENRPVKWMALESILEYEYSGASDVWSFGVFLWELVTLAQQPYVDIDPFELAGYLKEGYRLSQPMNCPDDLFGMMTCCWLSSPEERPTFIQLLACLQDFSTALNRFI